MSHDECDDALRVCASVRHLLAIAMGDHTCRRNRRKDDDPKHDGNARAVRDADRPEDVGGAGSEHSAY
jgi:hypothetical protein